VIVNANGSASRTLHRSGDIARLIEIDESFHFVSEIRSAPALLYREREAEALPFDGTRVNGV